MNNKKNPIMSLIVKMCLYFFAIMILSSLFLFIYAGMFYSAIADMPQQNEILLENITLNNENIESNNIDVVTNDNTFIVVERNRNYKIYVDTETRNMYITPNVYPNEGYTMMYDGDIPKIYTGTIDGETYQMFLNKKK